MKYAKITKDQVFNFMCECRYTIDFYEVLHSARLIAHSLNTSIYQARKYLRELKDECKTEYKTQVHYDYGDYGKIEYVYPPINGYVVKDEFYNEVTVERSEIEP